MKSYIVPQFGIGELEDRLEDEEDEVEKEEIAVEETSTDETATGEQ